MSFIIPQLSSAGSPYRRRLLQVRSLCDGQAMDFLRRLSLPQCSSPSAPLDQMIKAGNPYDLIAHARRSRSSDPALVPLAQDCFLLHFTDHTALIAEPSTAKGHVAILPMILDTKSHIRPIKEWAPFCWHSVRIAAQDQRLSTISALKTSRGSLPYTDISIRPRIAVDGPFSDAFVDAFLAELAREVLQWRNSFHRTRATEGTAWPPAMLDVTSNLKKGQDAVAQAWLGDLCTHLSSRIAGSGRLGLAFVSSPPHQDSRSSCFELNLVSGGGGASINGADIDLIEQMRIILENPLAQWGCHRILKIQTPSDNKKARRCLEIKLFGMSDRLPSHHRMIQIHQQFAPLGADYGRS